MPTHETQTLMRENPSIHETFRDYEPNVHSDRLRETILGAPESRGASILIPRNTITVRMNSETIQEGVFEGLAQMVDQIQEESDDSLIHDKSFEKLSAGTYMSTLNRHAEEELRTGEILTNITLVYDGEVKAKGGEERILSAVIVHETLSPEQIKKLREVLPEGVPMIDGPTNELLDDVGQEQREKSRERINVMRRLGGVTIDDVINPDQPHRFYHGGFSSGKADTRQRFYNWSESMPMDEPQPGYDSWHDENFWKINNQARGDTQGESASSGGYAEYKVPDNYVRADAIPESAEVKAHGMLLKETGGRSWMDLSAEEQRSVRRKVVGEAHPDRGGDTDLFRAAQAATPVEPRGSEQPTE